ncbi:hypothetical protein M0R89_03005 [Halorussus limi]|uniref:DUF7975 domain-containing protein n=1 Tax=Halorussus limi TaxID=2938695 RepID=A0A8U0HWS8_9EURY|nr:hypothetical protein [Halorussus limi]UPV75044.1 hypothetical protein M0R89_03005 [Halorussus limi]
MTRFDAAAAEERQKLFADGIVAHRERASPFVTFEADADASGADDEDGATDSAETGSDDADPETGDDAEQAPPWIQFGDGTLNLDCTDDELDDLKSLLGEFPAFKIDDLTRPEEAEGVNVRVSALADPNRVAQCVERVFREVYDRPESFRAWVTAV